jgi:hypothetical protein
MALCEHGVLDFSSEIKLFKMSYYLYYTEPVDGWSLPYCHDANYLVFFATKRNIFILDCFSRLIEYGI